MHLIIEIMQQTNINNCSWQLDLALWSAFTNVYVLEFLLKRWTSISPRLSIGQISKSTGRTQCVENLLYTQVKRDECVPAVWILALCLYKGDGCLSVSATDPSPPLPCFLSASLSSDSRNVPSLTHHCLCTYKHTAYSSGVPSTLWRWVQRKLSGFR